jgi:hypothetical protein
MAYKIFSEACIIKTCLIEFPRKIWFIHYMSMHNIVGEIELVCDMHPHICGASEIIGECVKLSVCKKKID